MTVRGAGLVAGPALPCPTGAQLVPHGDGGGRSPREGRRQVALGRAEVGVAQRGLGGGGVSRALGRPRRVAVAQVAQCDGLTVADGFRGRREHLPMEPGQQRLLIREPSRPLGSPQVLQDLLGQPDDTLAAVLRRPGGQPHHLGHTRALRRVLNPAPPDLAQLLGSQAGAQRCRGLPARLGVVGAEVGEPAGQRGRRVQLALLLRARRVPAHLRPLVERLAHAAPPLGDAQAPLERLDLLDDGLPSGTLLAAAGDVAHYPVVRDVLGVQLGPEQPAGVVPAALDRDDLAGGDAACSGFLDVEGREEGEVVAVDLGGQRQLGDHLLIDQPCFRLSRAAIAFTCAASDALATGVDVDPPPRRPGLLVEGEGGVLGAAGLGHGGLPVEATTRREAIHASRSDWRYMGLRPTLM